MVRPRGAQSLLLQEFLGSAIDWRYGYELGRDTGLRYGTLYPLLSRLENSGLLESRWEQCGGKARHMYRLTDLGQQEANSLAAESESV